MSTDLVKSTPAHVLPSLPYAENALSPVVSAKTLAFHYGKHHKGYVENLNKFRLPDLGGKRNGTFFVQTSS